MKRERIRKLRAWAPMAGCDECMRSATYAVERTTTDLHKNYEPVSWWCADHVPEIEERTWTVKVPAAFWNDHLERACRCSDDCPKQDEHESDSGRRIGNRVEITLNEYDLRELLSDADYYADPRDFYPELRSICQSARRTLDAVRKQTGIEYLGLATGLVWDE